MASRWPYARGRAMPIEGHTAVAAQWPAVGNSMTMDGRSLHGNSMVLTLQLRTIALPAHGP
eukprot:1857876-Lingulodinium_polyedra.AAC.1